MCLQYNLYEHFQSLTVVMRQSLTNTVMKLSHACIMVKHLAANKTVECIIHSFSGQNFGAMTADFVSRATNANVTPS